MKASHSAEKFFLSKSFEPKLKGKDPILKPIFHFRLIYIDCQLVERLWETAYLRVLLCQPLRERNLE